MNKELITKKDYQILGIKENSTSDEINSAYEKLLREYHPEKIKLEKYREPNDLEIKKYKEVEKVYKKFKLEKIVTETKNYVCCGFKEGTWCKNEFYPALWIKVEEGEKKYFCSQECYNSKLDFRLDEQERKEKIDEIKQKLEEFKQQKFQERKVSLEQSKARKIEFLKKQLEQAKVKPEELEPNNRNFEQEINSVVVQNVDDDEATIRLYDIGDRIEKDIWSKKKEKKEYCDNCGKEIKYQQEGKHLLRGGKGAVDNEGNHYNFCSEECCDKGMRGKGKWVVRKNIFSELLKWMEKEGITNIQVDQGKLVLEFSKNQKQSIEDNDLTNEQKEVKNFLQQIGKNSLSQSEARAKAETEEKNNTGNKWVKPVVIGGIVVLFVTLIGIILYKNKKKGY